ncbi:MAG: rod shape-determining protein MreD [Prevotellaceae bacterium]|jgi:rod shape-determining protein MreD|nr:rod shape-determining protein MreD [Prevotellaceae bacterium]
MKRNLYYFLILLLFCAAQIFIFERLHLGPFLYPCIYVLFILLFPFGYNTSYLMLWAFAMGLSVDLCTGSPGMHASACVCLAFLRPNVLKLVTIKGEVGLLVTPTLRTIGFSRYLVFVSISLLIHHAVLFGWECFKISWIHLAIYRILCSTALNTILVVLIQAAFFNKRRSIEI